MNKKVRVFFLKLERAICHTHTDKFFLSDAPRRKWNLKSFKYSTTISDVTNTKIKYTIDII